MRVTCAEVSLRAGKFTVGLLAIALTAAMGVAPAQTFRGSIVGTVLDQTEAPVPGAKVTAKNQATGVTRTTVTEDAGTFTIPELPIGAYTVTVEKEGFAAVTQADVRVDVGAEQAVNVTLVPARVQAEVEVTAQVPLVQTTLNTLGGTIEASQVENLPVNGRDYTKLIFLNPGVAGSPDQITDSPGSFGEFSVNGARGRADNFLLDGTDMNDGYRNDPTINQAGVFGTPATILPVDAVAELAVLSNFAPEYGRNAGAVINIVTKSGTNQFHGTAAEFFRNTALNARNFFNDVQPGTTFIPPKGTFHNNQFGGSLGGPIIKDRTFFFFDYEGQRESGGSSIPERVPTAAEIADSTAFVTSTGGIVNQVTAALLQRNPWPTPAPNPSVALYDPSNNISATIPFNNSVNSVIGKIDHNFNEKNLLTGRYYYGTSIQSFPLGLVGVTPVPGYNTVTPTNINLASLSYVSVISPNLVNEARAGFNRFAETFFPEDRTFNPNSIGLNTGAGPRDYGLPLMRFSGGLANLGANLSLPRGRVDYNWQFIDNVSHKLNRHEVKVGYEFRLTPVHQFFDADYRGRLDFKGTVLAPGGTPLPPIQSSLVEFLEGNLSGGRQFEGDSARNTAQPSHALYAQDSLRWTRRLTLNYGVRWDYFGVIHERNNLFSNFDPAIGLEQVGASNIPPGSARSVMPGISRLYEPDYRNFAPRLSVAYDVTGKGKTVVRAGWGIFYDIFSQDFFLGQLPFNTFNPGPAYNGIGAKPILLSFSPVSQIVKGVPVFPQSGFSATDVFAVDRHIRTPYMENYNVNIQQEITRNTVLQVGYVGSQGHRLFRYRDINQVRNPATDCTNSPSTLSLSCVHPFDHGPFPPALSNTSAFGYVNFFESSANSSYHSLQTQFRITNIKGLQTTLNYTYSHSIDNASDGQDFVANATQPNDSFRPHLERGNSNFDVRHRFVWMINYNLPARKGHLSKLTDGWGINSVLTLQSGQPFHVNFFDNYDGSGEFFPRPDVVGNPFAGTHTPDTYLNLSAFAVPCTFYPGAVPAGSTGFAGACDPASLHFGNMGRNSLIGPNFREWDLSLYKNTNLTEKVKMQFRAEFYNLPNHPNFSSPLYPAFDVPADNTGADSTGRGIGFYPLTQTGDVGVGNPFLGGGGPRGIQLAVKFSF